MKEYKINNPNSMLSKKLNMFMKGEKPDMNSVVEETNDANVSLTSANVDIINAAVAVTAGYFHDNKNCNDFCKIIQDICADHYHATDIYVSFLISPMTVVYNTGWGCPVGGEVVYLLESSPDPAFYRTEEERNKYYDAVYQVLEKIAKHFRQSTMRVHRYPAKCSKYVFTYDPVRQVDVDVSETLYRIVRVTIPDDVNDDDVIMYAEKKVQKMYDNDEIELDATNSAVDVQINAEH